MIAPHGGRKHAWVRRMFLISANVQKRGHVWSPDQTAELGNGNCVRRGHERPLQKLEIGRDAWAKASRGDRGQPLEANLTNAAPPVNDRHLTIPTGRGDRLQVGGSPGTGVLPNDVISAATSAIAASANAGSVPLATIATPPP